MAEHISYLKQVVGMTIPAIIHEYQTMLKKRRAAILKHRVLLAAEQKHARHHDEPDIQTANHSALDKMMTKEQHEPINLLQHYIVDLRREEGIERGQRRKFHRVFIHCADSKEYGNLGWIVSSDVDHCMICFKSFETLSTSRKHHCRACGNVICGHCSGHREFVEEIVNLGIVRICQLCDYGQSPIRAIPNDHLGVSMVASLDEDFVKEELDIQQHGLDAADHSDWSHQVSHLRNFGPVMWCRIRPVMVIRARRDVDRSNVYINLCSCENVPFNTEHGVENEKVVYLVIGEKSVSTNDCDLYDVAVSPQVVAHIKHDASGTYKAKVCEQVLIALSLLDGEHGFSLYILDNPGGRDYLHHKGKDPVNIAKQLLSEDDNDSDDGNSASHPHLAVPCLKAFEALHQVHSNFHDVGDEVAVRTKNPNEALEQREAHSERHRLRLLAKLMNRSVSQYVEYKKDQQDQQHDQQHREPHEQHGQVPEYKEEIKAAHIAAQPALFPIAEETSVAANTSSRSKINIPPINTSRREEDRLITKIFAVLPMPGMVIKAKLLSGNEDEEVGRTSDVDFPSTLAQRRSNVQSDVDGEGRLSEADDGNDLQKVFINVFQHKALDEMMLSERVVLPQPHLVLLAFGDAAVVHDKKGRTTPCYNILVPSSSFAKTDPNSPVPIHHNAQLVYLLEQVNKHFSTNLSTRDFVLPKVKAGFKGDPFVEPECFICKVDKSWIKSTPAAALTPRSRTSMLGDMFHQLNPANLVNNNNNMEASPSPRSQTNSVDLNHKSRQTSFENDSVVSDFTSEPQLGAQSSARRRKTIRSSITESLHLNTTNDGAQLLNPAMMLYSEESSLSLAAAQEIKQRSVEKPAVLLGWQILFFHNFKRDVYVITSMRKNHLSKTEFRLSAVDKEDLWTTLKRAENKSGAHFQPTRLVLPGLRDGFPPRL